SFNWLKYTIPTTRARPKKVARPLLRAQVIPRLAVAFSLESEADRKRGAARLGLATHRARLHARPLRHPDPGVIETAEPGALGQLCILDPTIGAVADLDPYHAFFLEAARGRWIVIVDRRHRSQ